MKSAMKEPTFKELVLFIIGVLITLFILSNILNVFSDLRGNTLLVSGLIILAFGVGAVSAKAYLKFRKRYLFNRNLTAAQRELDLKNKKERPW